MSKTSGGKGRFPIIWVFIAIGVVAFGAMFATNFMKKRAEHIATYEEFNPKGPPCPTLTAQAFTAGGFKAAKTSEYEGVVFARHAGNMSCNLIKTDGGKGFGSFPICQFTGPAVLTVTAPGGETLYFNTGPGAPATISLEDGAVKCVLASNFRLGDG